jgi:hypothetical protein
MRKRGRPRGRGRGRREAGAERRGKRALSHTRTRGQHAHRRLAGPSRARGLRKRHWRIEKPGGGEITNVGGAGARGCATRLRVRASCVRACRCPVERSRWWRCERTPPPRRCRYRLHPPPPPRPFTVLVSSPPARRPATSLSRPPRPSRRRPPNRPIRRRSWAAVEAEEEGKSRGQLGSSGGLRGARGGSREGRRTRGALEFREHRVS